jgi:hypothetical protein
MIEAIATPFGFFRSEITERNLWNIGLLSNKDTTSKATYILPSYLTYLLIKHYEIPTTTYFEPEIIELDNVDFVAGDEDIAESEELINIQAQQDAYFLKPVKIKSKRKPKIIFK